jgi:hypothetical protein
MWILEGVGMGGWGRGRAAEASADGDRFERNAGGWFPGPTTLAPSVFQRINSAGGSFFSTGSGGTVSRCFSKRQGHIYQNQLRPSRSSASPQSSTSSVIFARRSLDKEPPPDSTLSHRRATSFGIERK